MTLTYPNGTLLLPASKITIEDVQVIRVEPVDPATYSQLARTDT